MHSFYWRPAEVAFGGFPIGHRFGEFLLVGSCAASVAIGRGSLFSTAPVPFGHSSCNTV